MRPLKRYTLTASKSISSTLSKTANTEIPQISKHRIQPKNLEQKRPFHVSQINYRSQYKFYDLASKQPIHVFDPSHVSFNHSELSPAERANLVFGVRGSREASRQSADLQAKTIAGVRVPGRPEQPTNCCMSGCVNCVWEMYKDDIRDWKMKKNEARKALFERPELVWPEEILGPEPEERKSADPNKLKEAIQKDIESADDFSELDVSVRQFLKIEDQIRKKRREQKLAAMAAAGISPETASTSRASV